MAMPSTRTRTSSGPKSLPQIADRGGQCQMRLPNGGGCLATVREVRRVSEDLIV